MGIWPNRGYPDPVSWRADNSRHRSRQSRDVWYCIYLWEGKEGLLDLEIARNTPGIPIIRRPPMYDGVDLYCIQSPRPNNLVIYYIKGPIGGTRHSSPPLFTNLTLFWFSTHVSIYIIQSYWCRTSQIVTRAPPHAFQNDPADNYRPHGPKLHSSNINVSRVLLGFHCVAG